jgi:hypothetical protein
MYAAPIGSVDCAIAGAVAAQMTMTASASARGKERFIVSSTEFVRDLASRASNNLTEAVS